VLLVLLPVSGKKTEILGMKPVLLLEYPEEKFAAISARSFV
jgi:hypothetical protein